MYEIVSCRVPPTGCSAGLESACNTVFHAQLHILVVEHSAVHMFLLVCTLRHQLDLSKNHIHLEIDMGTIL